MALEEQKVPKKNTKLQNMIKKYYKSSSIKLMWYYYMRVII